jgi:hypothetical protein
MPTPTPTPLPLIRFDTPEIQTAFWSGIWQAFKIMWPLILLGTVVMILRARIDRWGERRATERRTRDEEEIRAKIQAEKLTGTRNR